MLKRAIILLATVSVCLFGQGALSQQASDPSFECLSGPGPLEVISGFYDDKFKPDVAPDKRFDARGANFEMPGTLSHSLVSLKGSGDNNSMCWAGGYFTASLSWHGLDVSWDQSKHGTDGDGGVMNNTTSATSYEDRMTWTGLHVFNMHDGIRTSNSESNWTIQHTWLDYIRDDCVENDHIYSGKIYDSLFDGCYTGVSVRPSSSGHGDGQGETITMDRVLLRMEPMPYPYKWDTKDDPTVAVSGYEDIPFGYGKVFKMDKGNEPEFKITNSVFLLEYNSKKTLFPPKEKVSVCSNNTIIWLDDPANAPTYLLNDFPGCFTIITDNVEGRNFWKSKVADWHDRHPNVGANRKPTKPGEYSWPRFAPITVPDGSAPVAVDDSANTDEDTAVIIDVAANDSDPDGNLDPASANSICTNGSFGCDEAVNGSLTDNGDGTITYTPDPGFTGSDNFVYEICDDLGACDTASVTITVSGQQIIYVSSTSRGNAGGISFKDEDILAYDTSTNAWSMYFDGSDVGLGTSGQDIDALHINADGSILLSLKIAGTIPDVGSVDDHDIVRFIPTSTGIDTAGSYELYFDGEDVDLTTSGEDIDAIGFAPDGRLVISTSGSFSVGGISGKDDDLLIFTATSLGETTSGSWELYFDGSDVGLSVSSEDIYGTWIDENGDIYLTTRGAFTVAGATGDGADIFTCVPGSIGDNTSCTFGLFWDGPANGYAGEVIDGFFLSGGQ